MLFENVILPHSEQDTHVIIEEGDIEIKPLQDHITTTITSEIEAEATENICLEEIIPELPLVASKETCITPNRFPDPISHKRIKPNTSYPELPSKDMQVSKETCITPHRFDPVPRKKYFSCDNICGSSKIESGRRPRTNPGKARSCFSLLEDIEYPFITGGSRYSQSDMDYYL
ncbi:unnamed protein product [Gordionus sp. m RMFG-2023]